jgi:hypothetical protein
MMLSTAWCATSDEPIAYGPYCFQNRYGVIQAGFVPFALGGIYYFHQTTIAAWLSERRAIVAVLLLAAILAMFVGPSLSATIGPFLGIPMTWILLVTAQDHRPSRLQDFIGRASYHLFIAHMPTAAVLVTGLHLSVNGIAVYLATIVFTLCFSIVLVPMEWRLAAVRSRVALIAKETRR